ncbi:MAG TPA: GNAT family N-acetyltransferase [Polyangiales bacterium]|nr:GNAT family N-acetyltransferase [Polyangiales bacterium]
MLAQNTAIKASTTVRNSRVPAAPLQLLIRPIRPSDAPLLQAEYARLSDSSRYNRFHSGMARIPDKLLRYLTEVDGVDHVALVAFEAIEGAPRREGRGVGVARFVRNRDVPTSAELAVVVIDALQGRGIARRLLAALADAAALRGIERFSASVLANNTRARRLMASVGATSNGTPGELRAFEFPVAAVVA